MQVVVANVFSASISIVLSYFWNHFIVFQKEHPMNVRSFVKFILVTGASVIIVQSAVIYLVQHIFTLSEINRLTDLSGTDAKVIQVDGAKVLAVLAGMVWNYMLYKLVVFKKPVQVPNEISEEGVVPY
jgi:putative flippase GtrA